MTNGNPAGEHTELTENEYQDRVACIEKRLMYGANSQPYRLTALTSVISVCSV